MAAMASDAIAESTTAQVDDVLVACIEDVRRGLLLQADLLQRCFILHSNNSPSLSQAVADAIADLSAVSETSCAQLRCAVLGESVALKQNIGSKAKGRVEPNGNGEVLRLRSKQFMPANDDHTTSASSSCALLPSRLPPLSQETLAKRQSVDKTWEQPQGFQAAREASSEDPAETSQDAAGDKRVKKASLCEPVADDDGDDDGSVDRRTDDGEGPPGTLTRLSSDCSITPIDSESDKTDEFKNIAPTENGGRKPTMLRKTTIEQFSTLENQEGSGRRMSLNSQMDLNDAEDLDTDPTGSWIDGVMNPNSPARLCWDLGVILLVLIDAMILPFQMAFQDGDNFFLDSVWLWITTIFFASDMIASLLTAYQAGKNEPHVPYGKLVTSKSRIARHYLRTWFSIDFASTIPWGKLADLVSGDSDNTKSAQMAKLTKIVKFVRFLRLMRMLRLAKLAIIWERVEASMGNLLLKQSIALFRVLFVLTGICHWNACIWWMLGQPSSLFIDMVSLEARTNWQNDRHWTTEPHIDNGKQWTWLEVDKTDQYIFCFYWTLGVMRTMPSEVQPVNKAERLYVMVFMFFAFSAFAICVALITQTFFKFSERKRFFDEDMSAVRSYMRTLNASDNVQSSVKLFLRHLYDRRKIQAKENSLLNNLPPSLTVMLKHAKLAPYLMELHVMKDLPERAFVYVSEMAHIQDLAPGTCLCKKGRRIEAAYVVIFGRLSYNHETTAGELSERLLNSRVLDGECLQHADPAISERTLVAAVCAEVIRIDRSEFFKLMLKHADFMSSFKSNILWDAKDGALADSPNSRNQPSRKLEQQREQEAASISAIVCA